MSAAPSMSMRVRLPAVFRDDKPRNEGTRAGVAGVAAAPAADPTRYCTDVLFSSTVESGCIYVFMKSINYGTRTVGPSVVETVVVV